MDEPKEAHTPTAASWRRWLRRASFGLLAAATVAVAVIVLRGGDDPEARAATSDAPSESVGSVLRPGDALVNGFVVVDGTTVAGGPVPTKPEVIDGAEYTRTSVQVDVPGDVIAAFRAYAEQAEALGYTLSARNAQEACWQTFTEPGDEAAASGSTPEPWLMTCAAGGQRTVDRTVETISIWVERTYPVAEQAAESFRLEFATAPVGSTPSTPPPPPWRTPEVGAGPARPAIPLEFPGSRDSLCGPALEVVERSRIRSVQQSCTSGWTVTLELTGSPDEIYAAYVDQIRATDPEHSRSDSDAFSVDGRDVRVDGEFWDDSSRLEARMIEGDADHAPVLWITFTNG